ncbi:MAG: hypothetical protein P8009_06680, partial [Gammaproteobacteria bacterium]
AYLYEAWFTAFIDPHGGFSGHVGPTSPYIWLLTWAYRAFGPGIWVPFGVNALSLAIARATMSLIARRLFGSPAGWATGVVLVLCGPLVFFGGLTVKTSLVLALASIGSYMTVLTLSGGGGWMTGGAILFFGLAALDRENLLVLIPWLFVLVTWRTWRERSVRAWMGTALSATLVLLVLAHVANWRPGLSEPAGFSPVGLNFYAGNAPGSWGGYTPIRSIHNDLIGQRTEAPRVAALAVGHPLTRWDTSRYWLARSFDYWRQHPWSYMGLQLRKLGLLFAQGAQGLPEQYAVWRWHRPALAVAIVDMGIIWALALPGLVFARRQSRDTRVLFLMGAVALYAMSVWLFFVAARYRITLLLFLAPFAGLTLARLVQSASVARWRLGLGVAMLYAASLMLNSLLPFGPGWSADPAATRFNEQSRLGAVVKMYRTQEAVVHHPTATEWAALSGDVRERRDLTDAARFARRAIELAPNRPLGYESLFRAQYARHDWASLRTLRRQVAVLATHGDAHRRRFGNLHRLIDQALLAQIRQAPLTRRRPTADTFR